MRSSTEPETKRAKLSGDASEASSIESRITSGEYNSIQELVNDIESASNLVIEQRQRNDADTNGYAPHQAKTGTDIVNRIAAFKKHLDNLLRRNSLKDISQVKSEPQVGNDETSVNGDLKRTYPREEGGTALTLYGNSANPKQMFSSLKQPTRVNLQPHDSEAASSIEIQTSLNESKLPNGISATKVVPHNDAEIKGKNSSRTIGQTFPPRSSLPQLEPPRKGKSAQKSSAMTWVDWFDAAVDSKALPNERGSYNLSALPSGRWLHYGGGTASKSNSNQTPQENGDSRQPDNISQRQFADDKALFQSAYSSFAPSFDSSGAIIPEDAKDQMWWNKFGEKRFHALLSLQYPEDELTGNTPDDNATVTQELDEDTLEEAVNSYIEENEFPDLPKPKDDSASIEDKDMEEVLNEIGELLETLNSYNRMRNLVPPGSRPGSEATPGTPDTPSTAEISIYETLKASLSAMIATLPPYAVAKLSGEQLSDLNISKKMLVENSDYHGTMEPDDYTAQQRHASRIAPATGSRTSVPNMIPGSRPNNYQSPAASSPYNQRPISSNPRSQTPRGYPPQQAYGARQAQPNHYAPNIAPQNFQSPRQPMSTPQRPTHGTPKYPQSASSQYGSHGSALQQFQRSSQNGVGRYSPQQGHSPAHSSPQQYQQRPTQPGYPQRAPESAYNTPMAAGRSASPQKPPSYATPQPHSPYMNSTPSAQQRYIHPQQSHHQMSQQPQQLHHYNNFPPSRTPPVPNNVPNSATIAATMPYQRSAAEQAALMDRNKTQLDMNQQHQSPQPSQAMSPPLAGGQPRRESMQGMNHTPGNQQNGMANMNASGSH